MLRTSTITFNMTTGISVLNVERVKPDDIMTCKTSCCIAGYAVMQFNNPQKLIDKESDYRWTDLYDEGENVPLQWGDVSNEAQELLGLSQQQRCELFIPTDYCLPYRPLRDYTDPAWAARVIRNLIATGEVDWEGCRNG